VEASDESWSPRSNATAPTGYAILTTTTNKGSKLEANTEFLIGLCAVCFEKQFVGLYFYAEEKQRTSILPLVWVYLVFVEPANSNFSTVTPGSLERTCWGKTVKIG